MSQIFASYECDKHISSEKSPFCFPKWGKIQRFWFWIDGLFGLPVKPDWRKLQSLMFRRPSWLNVCIPLQTGDIIKEETFILHLIQQPAENSDFTTAFDYYSPASWKTAGFSPVLPPSSQIASQSESNYLIFIFSCTSTLLFLPSSIWSHWPSSPRGLPLLLVAFRILDIW